MSKDQLGLETVGDFSGHSHCEVVLVCHIAGLVNSEPDQVVALVSIVEVDCLYIELNIREDLDFRCPVLLVEADAIPVKTFYFDVAYQSQIKLEYLLFVDEVNLSGGIRRVRSKHCDCYLHLLGDASLVGLTDVVQDTEEAF